MDTTRKANICPQVEAILEGSPQGDDGNYLFKNVIITPFWAVGQRCITEVGDDSVGVDGRQSAMAAGSRALVPFHIDGEVHRSVACGTSRSEEVNKKSAESKPKPTTELLSTTGASSLEMS